MREQAARVHGRGLCPFGNADTLACKILGAGDAGVRADINGRVTEYARGKYWKGNETGIVLRGQRDHLGERDFGDVEFLVHQKAVEHLLDRQLQHRELDAGTCTVPSARSRTWSYAPTARQRGSFAIAARWAA